MRHPHQRHQEMVQQSIIFLIALLLFIGASVMAVKSKFNAANYLRPKPTPTFAGEPSATPVGNTTLRLFNTLTNEPLRSQNIAFIITSTCDSATVSCPTSSPIVLKTDTEGQLIAPQTLILQQPKLYAAGYKTDRYLAFLSDSPTLATVYYPPVGAKTSYDISLEIVPIGLQPATP